MNVKVSAEKILYSLDKTDVPLALSWYDTGFDEVSDITCDGDIASVNQVARRIQFNDNGEVKVRFSVTNAFGTFESSELVLRCDDVVKVQDVEQEHFYDSWWFITLYFVPIAAFVAVGTILIIKKVKITKKTNKIVEEKDEGANK